MHAWFTSFFISLLAELGDKTQWLAFVLAARFRKPWPIIIGIALATLINHSLASYFGLWLARLISPKTLHWMMAFVFFAMAIWMLVPDKADENELKQTSTTNVLGATLLAYFLAEMGDKTQIATLALAAHYQMPLIIIAASSLGILIADIPAVFLGMILTKKASITWLRRISALVFMSMAVLSVGIYWSK